MKISAIVSLTLVFVLILQVPVHALRWDFKNEADLDDWTVIRGKWTIEDGNLRGELEGDYIGIVAGDLEWSDYTLEVETTVLEGVYTYWMVRVQDDPQPGGSDLIGSYYTLEREQTDRVHLFQIDAGQWTEMGQPVLLPGGHLESHIWKFEVEGNKITVYLDGEELLSAEDDKYEKGRIGLGGHNHSSATGKNIVLFDYVEVSGPGIPVSAAVKSIGKLAVAWGSIKVGY